MLNMNRKRMCVMQVIANPERLARTVERIVEDFSWVQWDGHTQRLYYLTHKVTHTPTQTEVKDHAHSRGNSSISNQRLNESPTTFTINSLNVSS